MTLRVCFLQGRIWAHGARAGAKHRVGVWGSLVAGPGPAAGQGLAAGPRLVNDPGLAVSTALAASWGSLRRPDWLQVTFRSAAREI